MAKDPAFLFYPNDWIGGTMGMTFEEKGAYMELLMMQFNRGHMTSHMIGQVVGQVWENISHKFEIDGQGLYFNARLEQEQNKRKSFIDSRFNNPTGKNKTLKKGKNKIGHMTGHTEDVNTNEILIKKGIVFKENFIKLISTKKWNKKPLSAIEMSLKKLDKYPEEFAVILIEDAIAGDYQGIVFTDTQEKFNKWQKNNENGKDQSSYSEDKIDPTRFKEVKVG